MDLSICKPVQHHANKTLFIFFLVLFCIQNISGRVYVVDQNHRKASDKNTGTSEKPFKTISRAAESAEAGDTVFVCSGIYRERVAPAYGGHPEKPVVYMAAPQNKVFIKGSEVWKPSWEKTGAGANIYQASIDTALFPPLPTIHGSRTFNPYKELLSIGERRLTLGQLFVDHRKYLQVDSPKKLETVAGSWMVVDSGNAMLVHFTTSAKQVANCLVELTVRERVFAPFKRGLGYIVVKGFIIEHCANQYPRGFWNPTSPPQAGALGCRSGYHWIIENNTIRYARTMGLDCGEEGDSDADYLNQPRPGMVGYHIIRNNIIEENGAGGIVGFKAKGCIIVDNTIVNNNNCGMYGTEASGMKFHGFDDGHIEANYICNNGVSGIWVDNRWKNCRITRNVVLGNTGAGIFIELGTGPILVDNNIIAYTKAGAGMAGDGIYSHDASIVTIAHNLVYFNANFGIWAHVGTDRGRGDNPVSASRWQVNNNMIIGNHRGAISLPAVSDRSNNNFSDYNLIAGPYEIYTSDTYGVPLGKPLFLVNINKGRITKDSVVGALKAALDSAQIPDENRPSLKRLKAMPSLSIGEWHIATGNDKHSVYPTVLRTALSEHANTLSFCIDKSVKSIECPPVEEVDRDFYGNLLPAQTPLPGPFQNLVVDPRLNDTVSFADPLGGPFASLRAVRDSTNHFILQPVQPVNRPALYKAWKEWPPQEKELSDTLTEKTLPEKTSGSPENPAKIGYFKSSVVLDGALDEWNDIAPLEAPYSEKDSGALKLVWNEKGIYGAVMITDTVVAANPDRRRFSDRIEIYVEKDCARSTSLTPYAVCYTFMPLTEKGNGECALWTYDHICDDEYDNLKGVWKSGPGGYTIEFHIPFEILGPAKPEKGTIIGFNYSLYNEHSPLEHFYCNSSHNRNSRTPYRWGTVELTKGR
ncbi:MAG: DUF1565 domain-containing protein [Chitinivibrionales bacterium]|nr:DUF1565 domain-containing protein [Chitinivibrionales bacterium]